MKALGYDITVDMLSNIETGGTSAKLKDIKAICDDDIAFSKLLKRYLIETINDSEIDIFLDIEDLLESINCFDIYFRL